LRKRGSNFPFRRRKLLFIASHWVNGGMERSLKTIIENMSEEWDCELLILRRIKTKIAEEKMGGFPYPKNSKITLIEAGTIIPIFSSLVKLFKERQPHLISTHITPTGNLMLLIFAAKKLACIPAPIVVTNHDTFVFPADEYITYPFRKYVLKKGVDYLITISYTMEKVVVENWKIPKEKVTTIYNPIVEDTMFENLREPPEYKIFPNCLKVVSVARLDLGTKDFFTLLRAFSHFHKEVENSKLFIIGEGTDKERVRKEIQRLNLEYSAFLLGARLNPYPYIKYADIFVHSSFVEGLGRTIVEAMALGCPAVAADCPFGPRELIGDNENGLLVPMGNSLAMAEAMKQILENGELRKRIVKNGIKKAREFRVPLSIRKREELFRKLLTGRHK
jgi:glycosyltransferase involved in cell wall biosynthesis